MEISGRLSISEHFANAFVHSEDLNDIIKQDRIIQTCLVVHAARGMN